MYYSLKKRIVLRLCTFLFYCIPVKTIQETLIDVSYLFKLDIFLIMRSESVMYQVIFNTLIFQNCV